MVWWLWFSYIDTLLKLWYDYSFRRMPFEPRLNLVLISLLCCVVFRKESKGSVAKIVSTHWTMVWIYRNVGRSTGKQNMSTLVLAIINQVIPSSLPWSMHATYNLVTTAHSYTNPFIQSFFFLKLSKTSLIHLDTTPNQTTSNIPQHYTSPSCLAAIINA
jgi:hypothetical protein